MGYEPLHKEIELSEFVAEMNDLIDRGVLRRPEDFKLWLEDVRGECIHCYHDISEIVNIYINYL
ncbi:MAG: hypothetical protein JXB19_01360 [Bacteroidales bacterium]|nr:hypothetical protein [Bacteroidales bacterium]